MKRLAPHQYKNVRPLYEGMDYSLSIHAVIEGNNPGHIFADDPEQPAAALAITPEGVLLAGDHSNPPTLAAIRRLFKETIFTGEVSPDDGEDIMLAIHPETWEAVLPALIPTHTPEKMLRYHYLCQKVKFDWRAHLPEGYSVHQLSQAILDDPNITIPEAMHDWLRVKYGWWSLEDYFERGGCFFVAHEGRAVSWGSADCYAGDQLDMGIMTDRAYRRKGLASVAVAAAVEHFLGKGFKRIGWHADFDNEASWKTAEKVGFVRNREYFYYFYIFELADHYAELGWFHYKAGEYEKTTHYYGQVFALRDENPDYYYHLTALAWGAQANREMALKYLHRAADNGWRALDYTRKQEHFRFLHDTPEWEAVLDRMREDQK